MKDEERYKTEMEQYSESLRAERPVNEAARFLQKLFNETAGTDGRGSPQTSRNELNSASTNKSSSENEAKTTPKDGAESVSLETAIGGEEFLRKIEMGPKNEPFLFTKKKISQNPCLSKTVSR